MALIPIPESLNPTFLADVLAKSADNGGDTLAEHTWAVLSRMADQYRLRPWLGETIADDRLWQRLYWGCFFHDFGKAAAGFQERLQSRKVQNTWAEERHRHEILSLAFVDTAFPSGHIDRLPVIAVVIAHHKDFFGNEHTIASKYLLPDRAHMYRDFLMSQLDNEVVDRLWQWFEIYGLVWARALGFPESIVEAIQFPARDVSAAGILRCLQDFNTYFLEREDGYAGAEAIVRDHHYRGLILTADHAGSAGTPPYPEMPLTLALADAAVSKWGPNPHQKDSRDATPGSTILIAPTGSGKTEAALLWAAGQMDHRPAPRLFYTLPYQASMNAMEARLRRDYFSQCGDVVAVQHSRATLKYYRDLMDADSGAAPGREAVQQAKRRRDQARLNYFPVQVFSPYQMLKATFRLKGYEPLLVDYTDALFIFDEIHAYDAERLALIIATIEWLAKHHYARFLIMTATLPPMVLDALKRALPGVTEIRATPETFIKSQRHVVHMIDADVLDHLDGPFEQWLAHQSSLVCCNTVARAQTAYNDLAARFDAQGLDPREHMVLLHGRFNGLDRRKMEQALLQRVGVDLPHAERRPTIVVATQAVEVSLNIDLDTLYSDPAPLEALLQRFGRVNRGRKARSLCPVHVFRQPLGEKESRPYEHRIVSRSLEVLEHHCQARPIDESLVTQMLIEIYQGDVAEAWRRKYDDKARSVIAALQNIVPYRSSEWALEQEFYKLFDGVQVLPEACYDDFQETVDTHGYLAASEYLVNISWGQKMQLENKGLLRPKEEKDYFQITRALYEPEFGLRLDRQLGGDDAI